MELTKRLYPLWRRLPRGVRRRLYEAATRTIASHALWTAATPKNVTAPLVVVGALSAPTGLGELSRLLLKGAVSTGASVGAVDLTVSLMQKSVVPIPRLAPLSEGPGTILLAVQPPNVAHALALLGRRFLRDKLRIGFWAWELEVLPPAWHQQVRLVHSLAAPSRFCQLSFARAFQRDVKFLPLPIAGTLVAERPTRRGPVTFGAALDLGSTSARKNPLGVLDAFELAFPADANVRLKLKIRDGEADRDAMARIRHFVGLRRASVELEVSDLTPALMEEWWRDIDVLVSLHRSEGLGLWPAEAMLRGIPVIATDWSATTEFITSENGWPIPADLVRVVDETRRYELPDAMWAEPDLRAAADAMREATDRTIAAIKSAAARAIIERRFSNEAFAFFLWGDAMVYKTAD